MDTTAQWHRLLVSSLQQGAPQPLAAMHKVDLELLCPLSCKRCGLVALRTRTKNSVLEQTCDACGSVFSTMLRSNRQKPSFRETKAKAAARKVVAPTAEPETRPTTPVAAPVTTAKRQKKAGLEKLLAQNRAREAEAAAATVNLKVFGL